MKPHGRDCPDRCSQCREAAGALAVPVKHVDQHGAELTIDGAPVRPIAQPEVPAADYYRRGGRRGGPAKARKGQL